MRLSGQSILANVFPAPDRASDPKTKGWTPRLPGPAAGTGEHAFGYTIPNLLIDHAMRNPHILPGFWRGVNINQNAIFMECFMDELAQAVGQDELEFRRKLMSQPAAEPGGAQCRGRADRLGQARAAGRLPRPRPDEGVRQLRGGGGGNLGHRRTRSRSTASSAAPTARYAVNPAQIDRQVAGSFVYGLSALFYQECTVKDGAHRADQLRHLQLDAHRRDAEGRIDRHAVRRQRAVGRHRRADHLRGRAGGDSTRTSRRRASASARSR